MKLQEIEKLWMADANIDATDLGAAALNVPKLHSKWYGILMAERQIQHALNVKRDELELLLEAYFSKSLTVDELKKSGLPDYSDKKVLRPDIPKHIRVFPEMVEMNLKIALQSDKVDFVKDILKQIHGMSFVLKDAINWAIFQAGGR